MAVFAYHTSSGVTATIEAPDRATAVREIIRQGLTPTSVEAVHAAGDTPRRVAPVRRSMSKTELANFIRELATALRAGLPLVQSLRTLARQGRSDRQKAMIQSLIDDVERGESLADAAASIGKPFNDLIVNLMRAGEASGRLGEVLAQGALLLDRDVKLRRSILAATLYPLILLALITVSVIVVVTVIVPRVVEPIAAQMPILPFPTRVVMGIAEVFGTWWWAIIPAILLAGIGIRRLYADPQVRMTVDTNLLAVPILGQMLRNVAVARFTRTLATLTNAGVPILQALRITRGTLGNRAMEAVIDEVVEHVAAGRAIADHLEESRRFPPMLIQIIGLGERSGRLDELLEQAADAFEETTETSIRLFTTALPPVLVIMMACVVGFIVLAIMLPLLEFQEAIQ